MADNAEERTVEGVTISVWEGSLTATCASLGIPKGTERRVTRSLEDMMCIEVLRRGVVNYPTMIALLRPPTEELWGDRSEPGLTSKRAFATLSQEVENLKRQMGGLNIVEAFDNHEKRLRKLESKSHKQPKG
jgi:hypothetical protein